MSASLPAKTTDKTPGGELAEISPDRLPVPSVEENAPPPVESDTIRHPRKRAFLRAFAKTGIVALAARAAGIHRDSHYTWLRSDRDYAEAFERAGEEAGDWFEAEAKRLAVEGSEQPVFYKGKQCGVVHKHSVPLLIFLLKGAKPEKYGDQRGGRDNTKWPHSHADFGGPQVFPMQTGDPPDHGHLEDWSFGPEKEKDNGDHESSGDEPAPQ